MSEGFLLTLILMAIIVALIYLMLTWNFNYWRNRGIRVAAAYPLFGSFPSAFTRKRHMIYDVVDIYNKYKNEQNFVGTFLIRMPQLLIVNPETVHRIYVNDFSSFHDNEFSKFIDEKSDPLMKGNPFASTGEAWKERRSEVTPGITSNRIKGCYSVTLNVCKRLTDYLKAQEAGATRLEAIDVYDLCLRYTCDVVTDCVLGIDAKSLTDKPTHIFAMSKQLHEQTEVFLSYQILASIVPFITKFYKACIIPKDLELAFFKLMQQAVDLRTSQPIERMDFLNYILQLQQKKSLSTQSLTSHVVTFLTDGFITTANTLAHSLLFLARDQVRQEKLREELLATERDAQDNFTFESISELPYLDACFHEALRLFPQVLLVSKLCTAATALENKDGSVFQLRAGEPLLIPAYALHQDERYYERPAEFMPERFLHEHSSVKSYRERGLFLGFGAGPRICVGMRFALAQGKAALANIIRHFRITANSRTRKDNQLDIREFLGTLDGGVWLDFEPIQT